MTFWLIVNGFVRSPAVEEMCNAFSTAAKKRGDDLRICKNSDFTFILPDDLQTPADDKPGAVLFWDKDLHLARALEARGLTLYNSRRAIQHCDDKLLTHFALAKAGLPQPRTIPAPLIFTRSTVDTADFITRAGQTLGWPMVVKEVYGSFGRQVTLCHSAEETLAVFRAGNGVPMLFQQFIAAAAGRDTRLYVVGGRVIAAMQRENMRGDFRSNIAHGGTGRAVIPAENQTALALAAARALGLDFCGVDLLADEAGKDLICEINSNAYFTGLAACTGADVAEEILHDIANRQKGTTS